MTITADGCWADYRTGADVTRGRPCLFLDRDGVLIEDTGYPHVPDAIITIPEALASVAAAQQAGFVVGIVSNQSGVGRGYFGWIEFAAVQAVIDEALAARGARLDFVLACPHHPDAALGCLQRDHPWRKPRPGMLLAARSVLGLDMARSIMLGDRASDMRAASAAAVAGRLRLQDQPDGDPSSRGGQPVTRSGLTDAIRSMVRRSADAAPSPEL